MKTRKELLEKIKEKSNGGTVWNATGAIEFISHGIEIDGIQAKVQAQGQTILFALFNHYDDIDSFIFQQSAYIKDASVNFLASQILADFLGLEVNTPQITTVEKEVVKTETIVRDQNDIENLSKAQGKIEVYERLIQGRKLIIE